MFWKSVNRHPTATGFLFTKRFPGLGGHWPVQFLFRLGASRVRREANVELAERGSREAVFSHSTQAVKLGYIMLYLFKWALKQRANNEQIWTNMNKYEQITLKSHNLQHDPNHTIYMIYTKKYDIQRDQIWGAALAVQFQGAKLLESLRPPADDHTPGDRTSPWETAGV